VDTNDIAADAISEITGAAGVTIDSLTIKDAGFALGSDADGDIYYRASGALARLAKGTTAQVLTMNSGATAPEWAAGLTDPMTTRGDIIIRNAANATARLGVGTINQVLTSDGTDVAWAAQAGGGDVSGPASNTADYVPQWNGADSKLLKNGLATGNASGALVLRIDTNDIAADAISEITGAAGVTIDSLTIKDAGFALGSDADGDIYYRASGALARLGKGTAGQVVRMNTGATAPEWGNQIKTIPIDAGAFVPCTTNGATTGTHEYGTDKPEMDYFAFSGATAKRVQFKTVMPSNWDAGTITVKFHWSSATGSTAGDTVEFACKAVCIRNDDELASAFGTAQVITDTLLVDSGADMQTSAATPAITIGGTPTAGSMVCFEVYRNVTGTDDMTEDAWLFGLEVTYGAL
jgi:ribosomal protein L12E/L44/L45/RPP1/RPP2